MDGAIDAAQVIRRLDDRPDVTRVVLICDLVCENTDGRAFVIPAGPTFWVQLADDDAPPSEPLVRAAGRSPRSLAGPARRGRYPG